ncbi:MAG: aminomethyltransferase [Actinomycetota bacterium]|nr:aminomethyltransferase [Actinomycetota bacterium]
MTQPQEHPAITSPLHEAHVAAGAKFAPFGGWLMPLEYDGVVAEHTAVRTTVGLFDVSHLGTLLVRGKAVVSALNELFTNDLGRIAEGQAQYTLLCDESGRVVDDLIVYLLASPGVPSADDDVLIVPNAANAGYVADAVAEVLPAGAEVIDAHEDMAIIAVQGPSADAVLADVGLRPQVDYMAVTRGVVAGAEVIVCRTGYTGERGFELVVPSGDAVAVWNLLVTAAQTHGGVPCGLGARDTLRTEMGYPLHGQDLGGEIGPVEARLSWAVGWQKEGFRGRQALLRRRESDLTPRLQGLVMVERGVPRPGMTVHLMPGGPQVGSITSGTFSPTLRTGIALALLDRTVTAGAEVVVNVRGRWLTARVTALPLVPTHARD